MASSVIIVRGVKNTSKALISMLLTGLRLYPMIPGLICESVSIRGTSRILKIALPTACKQVKVAAASIQKPPIPMGKTAFELDELRTYVGNKENQYWIAYALCSETKKVIDFIVGKRSKRVLRSIVNTLLLSGVEIIKTDKLNIYQSLIPESRHVSAAYNINHIERNNLNLRTHLKRLSRRTICFSRSLVMLEAYLKIYFWGRPFDKIFFAVQPALTFYNKVLGYLPLSG